MYYIILGKWCDSFASLKASRCCCSSTDWGNSSMPMLMMEESLFELVVVVVVVFPEFELIIWEDESMMF